MTSLLAAAETGPRLRQLKQNANDISNIYEGHAIFVLSSKKLDCYEIIQILVTETTILQPDRPQFNEVLYNDSNKRPFKCYITQEGVGAIGGIRINEIVVTNAYGPTY